jgi:hypothetical protein
MKINAVFSALLMGSIFISKAAAGCPKQISADQLDSLRKGEAVALNAQDWYVIKFLHKGPEIGPKIDIPLTEEIKITSDNPFILYEAGDLDDVCVYFKDNKTVWLELEKKYKQY